jgi:hypothetical protein
MDGLNLSAAAALVIRRLVLVRWLALLARTSLVMFGVLLAIACIWLACTLAPPGASWAAGGVLTWLIVTAAWIWLKRPAPIHALAAWDECTGRHEMFTSAYAFALQTAQTPGEQLHLRRTAGVLAAELPILKRQIPIVWRHRIWIAPTALIAITFAASFWHPAVAAIPDATVSPDSRQQAKEMAAVLAERAQALGPLPGLDQAERKQLESLKQSIDEAAKTLPSLESATPRKLLGELEQRARAAESLAESLGEKDAERLSDEMLGEMEQHADTADLAAALRADDAEQIAAEAQKLADQLADKALPQEQRQRLAKAFKKSLAAANETDRKSALGKQLAEIERQLQKKQPGAASKRLRDLAQSMTRRKQRQRSSRQLQQLARNLRRAGQQIFGNRSAGLQQLSQAQPPANQGLQRPGNPRPIPLSQLMASAAPQPGAGQMGRSATPQPSPSQAGAQSAPAGAAPVPGARPGGAQPKAGGQAAAPVPGTQPAGAGAPAPVPGSVSAARPAAGAGGTPGGMAAIPVPGTQPGGNQPGSMPGAGSAGSSSGGNPQSGAQAAGGGAQTAGSGATPGGLQAGTGSAPLGNTPVAPLHASRQGTVAAQIGAEGTSKSRTIDSLPQEEQAAQNPRRQAIEFIKVEEEALADEPLPAGRREQVRRYFDTLRKQLSTVEPESESPRK